MSRAEQAIFTNMCMIENEKGQILIQDRQKPDWPGVTFPGGHVEKAESFCESVIREVHEETGLVITQPLLCGVKQFQTKQQERYVVLFYRAKATGELQASREGAVFWIEKADLTNYVLAEDFLEMYQIFVDDSLSEFYYDEQDQVHLL
ncbi:8-oxo-dGTP diphosphatase [Enterococcus sp. DIV2402]|uniref:8-oxo-dGTP diphosphatase n=1 Tax=Candidatus Enterococcus lowellii TaxID=2230877 RepID=A0ABZ2SJU1_9ENTE|nr:8-oxo-dGTP diphosphatase [Enterococcus sp. DIV2402]MBO0465463.1 8-oxo-dGTP diphosphatase [Enterococcus sp. DIV2402]